jgi:hypothetical protein
MSAMSYRAALQPPTPAAQASAQALGLPVTHPGAVMPTLPMPPVDPEAPTLPPRLRDLLLAAALVAALLMLSMLVDLLHQNIERGERIRAAQRAHVATLVGRDRPAAAAGALQDHRVDRRTVATVAER